MINDFFFNLLTYKKNNIKKLLKYKILENISSN